MSNRGSPTPIPRWLWLWLPLGYLPFESMLRAIDREGVFYDPFFTLESGFVEMATIILLVPAIVLSIRRLLQLWRSGMRVAAGLLLVFAFGCLFLFLEEISYGQHFLGWKSPEYFTDRNLQDETNIHNLEFFNKNLLKWLTILGVLVAGIILPLIFRRYGVPERLARSVLGPVLLHSRIGLPTAAMAVGMHLLVKGLHARYDFEFHHAGFVNVREINELYIANFLFLYALALFRGLDASRRASGRVAH